MRPVESKLPNYHLRVDGDIVHEVKNTPFDASDETLCGQTTVSLFKKTVPEDFMGNFEVTKDVVTCVFCIAEAT